MDIVLINYLSDNSLQNDILLDNYQSNEVILYVNQNDVNKYNIFKGKSLNLTKKASSLHSSKIVSMIQIMIERVVLTRREEIYERN